MRVSRKATLTTRLCDSLKPELRTYELTDTKSKGTKMSVSSTGLKTWYFRYTFNGVKEVIRIGSYPATTVDDARAIANQYTAELDRGYNPKHGIQSKKDIPTLDEFAQTYLAHRKDKKSWADDESKFRLWIIPALGYKKLNDLTRQDIDLYRNKMAISHTNATANRHLALLSSLLSLAVEWEIIDKNVALGMKKLKEVAKFDGTLNRSEIRALARALEQEPNRSAANALMLLALTGLRRNEVATAQWQHYDAENRTLFLPDTKAGKSRYVPLPIEAIEVIERQARISDYIFYGKDTSKPINNLLKPFHRVLAVAGITRNVRIHDLRHTFASSAVSSGVSLFQVQALLGHSSPQMTQRYAHLQASTLHSATQATAKAMLGDDLDTDVNVSI